MSLPRCNDVARCEQLGGTAGPDQRRTCAGVSHRYSARSLHRNPKSRSAPNPWRHRHNNSLLPASSVVCLRIWVLIQAYIVIYCLITSIFQKKIEINYYLQQARLFSFPFEMSTKIRSLCQCASDTFPFQPWSCCTLFFMIAHLEKKGDFVTALILSL